jgi:hypothetical protein
MIKMKFNDRHVMWPLPHIDSAELEVRSVKCCLFQHPPYYFSLVNQSHTRSDFSDITIATIPRSKSALLATDQTIPDIVLKLEKLGLT